MHKKNLVAAIMITALTLITLITSPSPTQAKTVAGHTVFSEKAVEKRIRTIQDYSYNKMDKLTIRKQKMQTGNGTCTMNYYVHGTDLMFGYGTAGKTEYRLYFYKNQLVRMLVDESGQSRKTYKQLYKKLPNTTYDSDIAAYMTMENYARKEMEYSTKKTNKIISEQTVLITGISGNTITYHTLNTYGADGSMWSIGKKTYKAKLRSNVKITDYSSNPMVASSQTTRWLKNSVSSPYLGLAVLLSSDGTYITKIEVPYFA